MEVLFRADWCKEAFNCCPRSLELSFEVDWSKEAFNCSSKKLEAIAKEFGAGWSIWELLGVILNHWELW